MKNEVVFIGSGNVATHLAMNLVDSNYTINRIYSKTLKNARILAEKTNSAFSEDLFSIPNKNMIYVLSVSDSALENLCNSINFDEGLVIHTSGSVEIDVLKNVSNKYGVLYPLQTFSKSIDLNISKVPFFIEASDKNTLGELKAFASMFSDIVAEANSYQRKIMHLAAVFVSNFTNHMYSIAEEILEKEGLYFDIVIPLIEETIKKAMKGNPKNFQTGPAVREDHAIIERHLKLLENNKEFSEIYKLITQSIIQLKNK